MNPNEYAELERAYATVEDAIPQSDKDRVSRQMRLWLDGKQNQYAHDLSQAVQIGYAEKARRAALEAFQWNEKRYHVTTNRTRVSLTIMSVIQAAARMGMTGDDIKDGLSRRRLRSRGRRPARIFIEDDELVRIIERETRYGEE